jgi:phage anti-repressor protein
MEFKDFLKKYSNLNNEFIDDFNNIYEFKEDDNNDYIIDLELVSKWLETRKRKLKETLVQSYNKNIDYIIQKEKNGKISKSNKEIILLTPDCFKRMCLLSRTKKAEEVRTYYMELEKLLNNYKDYIIEGLKKTVEILENNQKEIPKNIKGVVYILKSLKDIDGIYRFGQTEDFRKRLANYNSANSDKMKVVYIYETKNIKEVEDCVLAQIKMHRYKKRKDFYEIDKNLLKSLINDCIGFTLKYKKKLSKNKSKKSKKSNKSNKSNKIEGGNDGNENLYLYIDKN